MPTLPMSGRVRALRLGLGAVLTLGLLMGCDSTATSSSSVFELGPSVILTDGGCTYAGATSLSAEEGSLSIPVSNDSGYIAVVSLLKVGTRFNSVQADVDEYNDAESVGEPYELTPDPGVTQEAQVEVDPAGEEELVSDVVTDTYAVLCLGASSDGESEGLDEAFLFGPLDVTE
ncbi:MAG TPA: hypothetical protein VI277_09825 [Candidatus Limnocylindria bacterium]